MRSLYAAIMMFLCIGQLTLAMNTKNQVVTKRDKKYCCDGGVKVWMRTNITTPLWFWWKSNQLYKELEQAIQQDDGQKITDLIGLGVDPERHLRRRTYDLPIDKPLGSALQHGKADACKALLNSGCVPKTDDVEIAFNYNNSDEIRDLILATHIAAHDSQIFDRVFHITLKKGTQQQIACALKYGADIDEADWIDGTKETPLEYAIRRRPAKVAFLLEQGASVTNQALFQAIELGNKDALIQLIERRRLLMQQEQRKALSFGQAVKILLDKEREVVADIWLDYHKSFPFHLGLQIAPPAMSEYLCSLGVDVNWQDYLGRTALWFADSAEKMHVLLAGGAECDIQDNRGRTVIYELASKDLPHNAPREDKLRTLLKAMLVYPRVVRSNRENVAMAQQALFVSLCALKRYCKNLPIDVRIYIMAYVFGDMLYHMPWGKMIGCMPVSDVVRTVPFEVQRKLTERIELTPGSFGAILDKEKLIQEHTEQHMAWLQKLLLLKDREGKCAYQITRTCAKKLDANHNEHFRYRWRGKIENEYRFLFDTGTLYTEKP
ncbi:MAG: hypothetical protein AB7F19_02825 [Candidatus Babeliales bacterium]